MSKEAQHGTTGVSDSQSSKASLSNTQTDPLNQGAWPGEARVKGAWALPTCPTLLTSRSLGEAASTTL